jgi:hypothetical protein
MDILNHFFFGENVAPASTVYHLNQALSLVNHNLNTPEGLCNTNISVVNFMIVHALLRGDRNTAQVHMGGLQKMLELRGGLSKVENDHMLMLKICK